MITLIVRALQHIKAVYMSVAPSQSFVHPFKKIAFLFCILLSLPAGLQAQSRYTLNNSPSFKIKNYQVLPDADHSFKRIITDTSLVFKPDSLRASVSDHYWVKIRIYNPYPNSENYLFSLSLPLNYTLYQYNAAGKKWLINHAGLSSPRRQRDLSTVPCVLPGRAESVFYLKIDLRDIKAYHYAIKPAIVFEKEVVFAANERFQLLSYLIVTVIVASFACYNLYIYFQLKDKAYLYYVFIQAGSLIYFTADKYYTNILQPLRYYNLKLYPDLSLEYYDINYLLEHAGVTLLFWALVQFTRSYLGTNKLLPGYDRLLKILAIIYVFVEVVPILITLSKIYYIDLVVLDNIIIQVILASSLFTAIIAYRRKIKAAKYFLAANLLPVLFTAGASAYTLMYKASSELLPVIAILSQILTFAVALVARVKLINDDLNKKALEALQLESDIKIKAYKQLLTEQENKHISEMMELEKERNELLQVKLAENQRELMGNSLYIHQKNKLLADIKTQVDTLHSPRDADTLKNIRSTLKDGQYLDSEWNKFKLHFEQVHPSFFTDLRKIHPHLTKYDQRLYAYLHINMSTKEIAALLNIEPKSVRQAKTRLNKKMGNNTGDE